ncbi:hypothetical protein B0H16DRAFT_1736343 [Mycena metata]|uniref:3'-5' exonuclease domain-containing protein n=1 Tax=Mycena metata TaxID=1033252 RepID=A0AAD7HPB0_9AGAR|nr:hypothetical protein B0H16DRAFT_1736343 [Mycena metata]
MLARLKAKAVKFHRNPSGIETFLPESNMVETPVQGDRPSAPDLPPFPRDFAVHYLTTESAVNSALEHILDGVVGFDAEFVKRRPSTEERAIDDLFDVVAGSKKSGFLAWQVIEMMQGRVSFDWDAMGLCVVQISSVDVVWVINLRRVKAYPRELRRILTSTDILKVGVGLLSDIPVIWSDLRSELQCMTDPGMMARLLLAERFPDGGFQNLSLQTCAAEILGFRVDKTEQVSDWSGPLTQEQIHYAATDAIAALRLYQTLRVELAAKAESLGRDIPVAWYSFNSRFELLFLAVVMHISALPDRCILECIKAFLGRSREDFVSFVRARNVASSVDHAWKGVVEGFSPFWAHIVLTQHVPPASLQRWLDNGCAAQITIDVIFAHLQSYYRYGDPSTRVCSYARNVLPILLPSTERWVGLRLGIEDSDCASMFISALRHRSAPSLQSLTLDCPVAGFATLSTSFTRPAALPYDMFSGGCSGLERLSLSGGFMHLAGVDCFGRLRRLELCGSANVTTLLSELLYAFRMMQRLEALALSSMPVAGRCLVGERVVLPSLSSLQVDFGSNVGLGLLISSFDLPSLSSVVLILGSAGISDIESCLSHHPFVFSGVLHLTIRNPEPIPISAAFGWTLFASFPSINALDLRDASDSVFKGLLDDSHRRSGRVLLPKLRALTLGVEALGFLAAFIDSRAAIFGSGLTRLTICDDGASVCPWSLTSDEWIHICLNVLTSVELLVVAPLVSRFAAQEPELS